MHAEEEEEGGISKWAQYNQPGIQGRSQTNLQSCVTLTTTPKQHTSAENVILGMILTDLRW